MDRTEGHSEGRLVDRMEGHSEGRLVDRMEGHLEGLRAGRLEGLRAGRLEGLRVDRLVDRMEGHLVGPRVGHSEDQKVGRMEGRWAGHLEEVSQVVLVLVYLEPTAWLVESPRFQLRVVLARKVASKGDPQVLARQQVPAKAQKEQVTEEPEGGRLGQGAHLMGQRRELVPHLLLLLPKAVFEVPLRPWLSLQCLL